MSDHPNPGWKFMGLLPILTLSGGLDTGNIGEENGSGFQVTGINVRSLTPPGFQDAGSRGEGAGSGSQGTGSIGKK
jgi:hypothetical protein